MKTIKLISLFALAASLAPAAFAETGVHTLRIDHVANIYGRAGMPAVKTLGAVVTRGSDVNLAGRAVAPASTFTVLHAGGKPSVESGRS